MPSCARSGSNCSQLLLPAWGVLPVAPCAATTHDAGQVHSAEACLWLLSICAALSQCVLTAHVLPNIRLVKHHNGHGIHLPAVLGGFCSYSKSLGKKEEGLLCSPVPIPLEWEVLGRPLTSGMSAMEYTTTPWYCAVFSVMRPRPDFSTWLP